MVWQVRLDRALCGRQWERRHFRPLLPAKAASRKGRPGSCSSIGVRAVSLWRWVVCQGQGAKHAEGLAAEGSHERDVAEDRTGTGCDRCRGDSWGWGPYSGHLRYDPGSAGFLNWVQLLAFEIFPLVAGVSAAGLSKFVVNEVLF